MKKHIDGVVFDCDGPLLDTWPVMVETSNMAIANLGGMPRPAEDHYDCMEVPFDRYWQRIAPGMDVKALEDEFKKHFVHRPVGQVDGAHAAVRKLARAKYVMGVLSATPQDRLEREMRRHGFDKHFRKLLGDHKHKTEGLLSFCKDHELKPVRTAFVEDSWSGVEHGNEAGVVTIGLALYGREDVIRRGNPKHVIRHMSELPGLLAKLNQKDKP